MSYHISTIDGNLTADPKALTINDHKAVEISIAINYTIKGDKKASFFRVVFYNEAEGDYLLKYGKKGSKITVTTDVRTTEKEKATYTNYIGTRVLQLFTNEAPSAKSITDVDTPATAPVGVTPSAPAPAPSTKPATPATDNANFYPDDLPF